MPQGQKNPKTEDDDGRAQDTQTENGVGAKKRAGTQAKRRCVSSACIACRKRKSKCDGNTPSCAACSSVYFSECIYDPSSDHRRKTSIKKDNDSVKTRNSTLQTLMQAILTYPEDEVYQLVLDIRGAENLDELANEIASRDRHAVKAEQDVIPEEVENNELEDSGIDSPNLETDITGKMNNLRLESDGQVRSFGGTSLLNLLNFQMDRTANDNNTPSGYHEGGYFQPEDPILSWTSVTSDKELIIHLINMYFTWHYPYFTTLSKSLFFRDFLKGNPASKAALATSYCTPLLVNAMLALGCHFTVCPGSRTNPNDPATAGNHFFNEAKRLILENDEHETPRLTTVQALGLMSVREAGCGREARGWVYSGMSFRMACDLGLHLNPDSLAGRGGMSDEEIDARKVTLWGVFLFDKCWSNYMGRMPQLPSNIITCPKYDVFPDEDSQSWSPYTDNGLTKELAQPSRTRAVSLQISALCEISNDILLGFYVPTNGGTTNEARFKKGERDSEMKRLVSLHARLEDWVRKLPAELEAKEGALASALVMHMFCQLLYLLLFRPFLKLGPGGAAFPPHIQPRKICTIAATNVSKYLRIYKRTYGLKQICNVAVYIVLSACTVHLINLPTKAAKRDIIQGVKSLEEIAEYWLCAKRALIIVKLLANRYGLELPEEAEEVLSRMNSRGEMFGCKPHDLQSRPRSKTGSNSQTTSPSPHIRAVPATPGTTQLTEDMLKQFETQSPGFLMPANSSPTTMQPSITSVQNLFTPYFDPGSSPSSQGGEFVQQAAMVPSANMQVTAAYVPPTSEPPVPSSSGFGFDTLVDQSQQWWLKDQVQLAMDYGRDWPGQDSPPVSMGGSEQSDGFINFNPPMGTGGAENANSTGGSPWTSGT